MKSNTDTAEKPLACIAVTDIFIIIVNWNTAEILAECLNSIRHSTQSITYDICVVDNGSTDGSAEMIVSEFPEVLLIRNSTNKGFAAANNQGIHASTGRYILLLNSDTIVPAGALEAMVAFADEHRDVGILGPKLINADGIVEKSGEQFPSLLKSLVSNIRPVRNVLPRHLTEQLLVRGWEGIAPCDVGYISGACMLVRREAFEQAGMLDEDYFMYGEEIDWCYRIRNAGWRVVYYPQVEIVHLRDRSGTLKWGNSGMAARKTGERLFYQKSYGRLEVFVFCAVQTLLSLMRFFGNFVLSLWPAASSDCRSLRCQQAEMYKLSLLVIIGLYDQKHLSRRSD
ncbi:MAG: glycosyltransferase family 2 protein [Anaerolinea sp.]|nr:glycosyltransferase family 2 protein [Anaerolinea sp.]